MAHATKKSARRATKRSKDAFAEDELHDGEYETPGPRIDPDAAKIGAMLSDIKKRQGPTGHVIKWSPQWLKRANEKSHEAAVKALSDARRELAEASTEEERSQGNIRVQMATDAVRTTQLALQRGPDAGAFTLYFLEDKLAVDLFDREQGADAELDAQSWGLTPLQQIEANLKASLCAQHGILYLALGPDDELDKVQLAAKLGLLTAKRGSHQMTQAMSQDGITEEDIV